MSDKNKGYFWYSQKQREMCILMDFRHNKNYCMINGEVKQYTEWKKGKNPSKWDDAVFLGYGTYHHSE